ncbi:MAG: hypothetical protein V3U98_04005 [Acidobacteriota bacterium]
MHGHRSFSLTAALLLAAPLLALASWLVAGGLSRSFGPDFSITPPAESPAHSPRLVLAGFPAPTGDFPAERLYEHVDGAADSLRAAGCGRILVWRMDDPPAVLELLVFEEGEGASRVLARDVGPERTPGPGDEASVGEQAIFFRRGRFYARLFAEPGAPPDPARLLELATRVDDSVRALSAGGSP